jgi:hypothetical protein
MLDLLFFISMSVFQIFSDFFFGIVNTNLVSSHVFFIKKIRHL